MLDSNFEGYLLKKAMEKEDEATKIRSHVKDLKSEASCAHCIYWSWKGFGDMGECSRLEKDDIEPLYNYAHDADVLDGYLTKATFACKYMDCEKK